MKFALRKQFLILFLVSVFYIGVGSIELRRIGATKFSLRAAASSAAIFTAFVTVNCFEAQQTCLCCNCIAPSTAIISIARSANLPEGNGASGKIRGTETALAAIRKLRGAADMAQKEVDNLDVLESILSEEFPSTERAFKRLFDEYSNGISYKQQFLDKNAFLVYYTKGFDGPGRNSIEKESDGEALQKLQYGYRNDAWISLDEARGELEYLLDSKESTASRDLRKNLRNLDESIMNYIKLTSTT